MNMPGLTAEASLYETSERYHMVTAQHRTDGIIHAAYWKGADWVSQGNRELFCTIEWRQCVCNCADKSGPRLNAEQCFADCKNTFYQCA
jgi:hypothetical protein